jgi:hypothetical protein
VDLAGRHRHSQRAFLARFGGRTIMPHGSEPVYARTGYRTLGRLQLWERRLRNDSA